MSKIKIGVFVGSLRKQSFSRKVAKVVMTALPEDFEAGIIDIGELAIFNQDYDDEGATPHELTRFREEVKALDGVLFVTPEYNRSVPPVLKNALDVGSRPYGQNVWDGKPGALIGVSIGAIGGFGAAQQVRQSLSFLNVPTLGQPEAYIGNAQPLFNDAGEIVNEGAKKFLAAYADAFAKWVRRLR